MLGSLLSNEFCYIHYTLLWAELQHLLEKDPCPSPTALLVDALDIPFLVRKTRYNGKVTAPC